MCVLAAATEDQATLDIRHLFRDFAERSLFELFDIVSHQQCHRPVPFGHVLRVVEQIAERLHRVTLFQKLMFANRSLKEVARGIDNLLRIDDD